MVKATATATVTAGWRSAAEACGARPAEIRRMQTAFDHHDLTQELALWEGGPRRPLRLLNRDRLTAGGDVHPPGSGHG